MQPTKTKPSLFPYGVALAIILVNLAFDAISIYRVLHMYSMSDDDSVNHGVLYIMLGNELVTMVFSVAFGLACTQWLLERRRILGLPGYAAVCIGVGYAVLSATLTFSLWFITRAVSKQFGEVGMNVMVIINVIVGHVMAVLAVVLPVWLIFRLLRKRERPALYPVELRWRALLIFTLFVWVWVLLVMQFALPAAASLGSVSDFNQGSLALMTYGGSLVLVLPAFLGALIGLPRTMPHARALRLLLASVLLFVACALAMVIVTYTMVHIGGRFIDDFEPGQGFAALVALVWFVVSVPLCGLLVRMLTRRNVPSMPYGNIKAPEEESGFSMS